MATTATDSAPLVIIVGAGPSGLAATACLMLRGVSSVVLERDDCVGSLWRKCAYDCLHLHLPKHHSALPHVPHPDDAPTYLPRNHFVRYLDAYADRFALRAHLRREGEKGLYRAGMAARGLTGSGTDTEFIADDINRQLQGSGMSGDEQNGNGV